MVKRLFDVFFCSIAILVLLPIMLAAAVGVVFSDPGSILYRARRAGLGGKPFSMLKFRSMYVRQPDNACSITGVNDPRVFPFGHIIRQLKIDELPQLWNVLRGDMSIVGPRPEDPRIVDQHYGALGEETLSVRPGLASPGSLFIYTHGDKVVGGDDPERSYVEALPMKLAIEAVYVRNASLGYDLRVIGRTLVTIALIACGRKNFPLPAEVTDAQQLHLITVGTISSPESNS